VAFWHIGEKEPWLLATNLDDPQAVLRCYRRRMWIEEMFGDLKGMALKSKVRSYGISCACHA